MDKKIWSKIDCWNFDVPAFIATATTEELKELLERAERDCFLLSMKDRWEWGSATPYLDDYKLSRRCEEGIDLLRNELKRRTAE